MHHRTLVPRPRMTERQRAANRSNARRSTGPRTAAGKRRSSLNALKHGVFAQSFEEAMKVFGEDRAEFDRLHRDFVVSFHPQTPFEAILVDDLAFLWWKKRRLDRGENGLQVDEVQNELYKRRRELSDTDAAPITEGDEAIKQSGLLRVKDCKMKFQTAEQHLEMAISQAERRDPDCDVETLLFMLYGQQPNWRAGFIQTLAERLREAEEQAASEEAEEPREEPSEGADGNSPHNGVNLQSSIENRQSFEEIPAAPEPESPAGGKQTGDDADDASSPRVLRALLVNELTAELLEVYRQHELYLERITEFSPAARDACLAPSGARWILSIRNQNSIERQIDRKLKQLRTLQTLDGWGGRLRRQCAGSPLGLDEGTAGALKPPPCISVDGPEPRNPIPESRIEPRVPKTRDVKFRKRSHYLLQDNPPAPKNEAITDWQRNRNSKSETRNSKRENGKGKRENGKSAIGNRKSAITELNSELSTLNSLTVCRVSVRN